MQLVRDAIGTEPKVQLLHWADRGFATSRSSKTDLNCNIQIHPNPCNTIHIHIYNHIHTYTYIHHEHPSIDSDGKLQHPNHTGSVDVSSAFPPKKTKFAQGNAPTWPSPHLSHWLRSAFGASPALQGVQSWEKGEATEPGSQRSGVRRPGVWEGGFKALERGGQWPLLKMGGESLRIGILQLKQLKAYKKIRRVDLLCSFKLHVHPLGLATDRFHPFAFGFVDPMLELAPYPSDLQGTAHSCSSWVLAGGPMDMARSCCDSHGGRGQDRKHRSPTRVLIDENSCR